MTAVVIQDDENQYLIKILANKGFAEIVFSMHKKRKILYRMNIAQMNVGAEIDVSVIPE
jgi:hypothetical protein